MSFGTLSKLGVHIQFWGVISLIYDLENICATNCKSKMYLIISGGKIPVRETFEIPVNVCFSSPEHEVGSVSY